ncbi:MAG: NfeD family protein [Myxococcaceae bacterium]|nr:NfeD family protein [Myxococcaceae bacterium]
MIWIALVFLLFVVGVVLLGLELFVIPGFGVVGVLGIAGLVGSVVVAFWKLGAWEAGLTFALGAATCGGLLFALSKSRASKALVLTEVQSGIAVARPDLQPGTQGIAATPLRPSGIARFADKELDVVSEAVFVEPGTSVRVTRVQGATIFVAPQHDYQGG